MKKLMFALLLAAALVGCDSSQDFGGVAQGESHFETIWSRSDIAMIRIDGHLYIIGFVDRSRYGSGVRTIVHAESCPCKSIEKKGD